jgi:hypothetical protein
VVSFPQLSPPKPCIRFSSPPYAIHAPPIFFATVSSEQWWWAVQIINLLIIFSPLPCYLNPLRPKYSPKHTILQHTINWKEWERYRSWSSFRHFLRNSEQNHKNHHSSYCVSEINPRPLKQACVLPTGVQYLMLPTFYSICLCIKFLLSICFIPQFDSSPCPLFFLARSQAEHRIVSRGISCRLTTCKFDSRLRSPENSLYYSAYTHNLFTKT